MPFLLNTGSLLDTGRIKCCQSADPKIPDSLYAVIKIKQKPVGKTVRCWNKCEVKVMDLNLRQIPVFVFPTTLKFYLNSRQTHKQLLTIYNPYDFKVRFKVLSTAPNKYTVIDPEGSIGPQACIDLVVRHTMPVSANCNILDKFRVSIQDHTTKQVLGKRDIEARLLQGEPDNISNDGDNFHSLPYNERSPDDQRNIQIPIANLQRTLPPTDSTKYIALITALICIFALMLPTKQEVPEPSKIHTYLHPSVTLKLAIAYVLGLVSTVILRL